MLKPHNLFLFSLLVLSVLVFVPTQDVYAAIPTVVDAQGGNTEGGTTCQVTVNVSAATDLIVVGANSDAALTSVADEDLQTYTSRVSETTSHYSRIWTTTSPSTNAANTITVTGSSGDITCFGITLSGVDTTSPIGNTGSASGTSGTTDTITYSTANDNSLIVHTGGDEWNSDKTWDTGKTEQNEQLNGGANKFGGAIATEGVATAGSNDGTFTWGKEGVGWSHAMVEIKEANNPPVYNIDLLDVYESASTTLDTGTAVCTDVDTDTPQDCNGINTRSYVDNYNFTAQTNNPRAFEFSDAGTSLFALASSGNVLEYTCTAFDVSTCSYVDNWVTTTISIGSGMTFSGDGKKLYVLDQTNEDVTEISCTSAFDISTCSSNEYKKLDISTDTPVPRGLTWSLSGHKLFTGSTTNQEVNEYSCRTSWDIDTCSVVDGLDTSSETAGSITGIHWSDDGRALYVINHSGDEINTYACSPWDVSTCNYVEVTTISEDIVPWDINFNSDFTKLFVLGEDGESVYEYDMNPFLKSDTSYRFELEVDNTGGAGSPNEARFISTVNATNIFGGIDASDVGSSGCGTNTDWTDNILTGNTVELDAGTTCEIAASGTEEYWSIINTDNAFTDETVRYYISDGTVSDNVAGDGTSFDALSRIDYVHRQSDDLGVMDGHPIGHWEFEDDLTDSSGHGNTGTLGSGSAVYATESVAGKSFNFTDNTARIEVGDAPFDYDIDEAFSVSMWVWYDEYQNQNFPRVITKGATLTTDRSFGISTTNATGKMSFSMHDGDSQHEINKIGGIFRDSWQHWVITKNVMPNKNAMNIYVNGTLISTGGDFAMSGSALNDLQFTFGSRSGSTANNFDGLLDEVRFYTYVLDQEDVTELYNLHTPHRTYQVSDGLGVIDGHPYSHWRFENNLNDSSGHGNHDTLNSNGTATYVDGVGTGNAFDFNDWTWLQADTVSETNYDMDWNEAFSVSFWIKAPSEVTSNSIVIGKKNEIFGSAQGWEIYSDNTNNLMNFRFQDGTNIVQKKTHSSDIVWDDTWHHFVAVWDGNLGNQTSIKLYLDGQESSGAQTSATLTDSILNDIQLTTGHQGNEGTANTKIKGTLDEVMFFRYAISSSKALELYELNNPYKTYQVSDKLGVIDGHPTGQWRFEDDMLDSSGHGVDMILDTGGTETYTTLVKEGTKAFDFVPNTMINHTSTVYNFDAVDPFSGFAWVYMNQTAEGERTQYVFARINQNANPDVAGWQFMGGTLSDGGLRFRISEDNTNKIIVNGTTKMPTDEWKHIGFTYDGKGLASGVKLYINGVDDTNSTISDTLTGGVIDVPAIDFHIGGREDKASTIFFNGTMDDPRIYNYALSPSQVTALYNSYSTQYQEPVSDPLSITDSVATQLTRFNQESDPLSITDSVATTASYTKNISDALSITDSVSASHGRTNTESDPISITDSVTETVGKINTESDPISITDSITTMVTYGNTESDPLSITDNINTVITRFNSESDPISITDSVTETVGKINTESDALSITDSTTASHGYFKNISDALSITDSVTENCTGCGTEFNQESDPISITDNVTTQVARINQESDALSMTDTTTETVGKLNTESDALSITDSMTASHGYVKNISDALSITDSVTENCTGCGAELNQESDPISITDSVTATASYTKNISDALSITDTVTSTTTLDIMVTEGVDVLDQYQIGLVISITAVEEVDVDDQDEVTLEGTYNINAVEEVDILDLGSAGTTWNISATEGVNVNDQESVEIYFYQPDGKYIWFNVSPASGSTVGGVYADSCPVGESVVGINDGRLLCSGADTSIISKSFTLVSTTQAGGDEFIGGYYEWEIGSNDFDPPVTFGEATNSYHGHVGFVIGSSAGDELTINVNGTSVTNTGVYTTLDAENVVVPNGSPTNSYFETNKFWVGDVTISVESGTPIASNYGYNKYWDYADSNFILKGIDATWLGGANDATADIKVIHHKATGWVYSAGGKPTFAANVIDSLQAEHGSEAGTRNGVHGAWKETNWNTFINSTNNEGIIIEVITGSARSFESGNILIKVDPQ